MKKYLLILIIVLPLTGNAQPVQFTKDSIPMVDGEIVFYVDFEADLSKTEFHQRSHAYLDEVLDPYSGDFIVDNNDHTACRVIDYIDIGGGAFQSLGMYMTYHLQMTYADGSCTMVIRDITYMEKRYFEAQEASSRKLNMPKYTGEEVMLDKKYWVLTKKKASEEVTMASLDRINEIVSGLSASFVKDSLTYAGSASHGVASPNQSLKKPHIAFLVSEDPDLDYTIKLDVISEGYDGKIGKTWTDPEEQTEALRRRPAAEGQEAGISGSTPKWHAESGKLLGTGRFNGEKLKYRAFE